MISVAAERDERAGQVGMGNETLLPNIERGENIVTKNKLSETSIASVSIKSGQI